MKGPVHSTTTPSGNVSYSANVSFSETITDPNGNVVYQTSSDQHYHNLSKDDLLQELSNHAKGTFSIAGQDCAFSYAFHMFGAKSNSTEPKRAAARPFSSNVALGTPEGLLLVRYQHPLG